ncbi:MAG: eukaryotic-like serine/threonine-protein kinase [Pyrinomonadaceae bacterium]|nr:eukaryotic-like serine/threonine-protein kinase [Pyrinomonadaceae bacterium]
MATETIIGSYRIEERIGRGGMGVVYRGQHTKLPREVAIKSINPRAGDHDLRALRHRFEREAYIQSQLDHPGIVKIYDYIVAEQTYYIVMEYVEGRSLAQLLKQEGGALVCERALALFDQILTAVVYAHTFTYQDQDGAAHRGIIHRDLKPPNILVTPDDHVKITDFGIVKVVGSETTDTHGSAYGSPRYVSPEQAEGLEVDQRSDIYSLGIILYEMLTGAPPFGNEREPLTRTEILRAHVEEPPPLPTEINPRIPLEVEDIILRALEKDPAGRYATATDFLRAIKTARERDAGEAVEAVEAEPKTYRPVGTHELHDTADNTVRHDYITQPIRSGACPACGTEAEADEQLCRACGAELGASPATTKLAHLQRQSAAVKLSRPGARANARGKWVVIGLIALMLLSGVLIYLRFTREAGRRAQRRADATQAAAEQTAAPQVAAPATTTSPTTTPALAELSAARVAVDSSYEGYTARPLNDGVLDVKRISAMRYNEGNWASAETPQPHWIELGLGAPARVSAVYVYWGFDRGRFVASRRVELQTPGEGGEWRTISHVEPGSDYDRTAFEFAPVTTDRLRILQPAQQGTRSRPFVMWVREVKLFGAAE